MKKFLKSKSILVGMTMVLFLSISLVVFAAEIPANGTYSMDVTSNSAMFKVTEAKLTVLDKKMTSVITLSGTGYSKLFMGTKEEAAVSSDSNPINYVLGSDGMQTYKIPVSALDTEIKVAAFSIKNSTWYDRILTFNSSTLAEIQVQKEEPKKEDSKKEHSKKEEPKKEDKPQVDKDKIVKAEVKEEPIPKTGDSNTVVISTMLLLGCVGTIARDRKIKGRA